MDASQSKMLDLVAEVLEQDEEFYVPVKKLWIYFCKDGDYPCFSLTEFTDILKQDSRFELVKGIGAAEGLAKIPPDGEEATDAELESQGFYSGPRIGLKTRRPTAEDLLDIMEKKTQQISDALKRAWESRVPEDSQSDDQLLDALAVTQKLQREIEKISANLTVKENRRNGQR